MAPALLLDKGETLSLGIGAPLRLRMAGGASGAEGGGGWLRARDWDERSDFGQLLGWLRWGTDASPGSLWAGVLEDYSLLSGHLVRRYSNRAHPDYHPAGASLAGGLGPLYMEAFASDVLAARLFGGEVEWDVGRLLGSDIEPGRYVTSVSAVHDFGLAGGRSPSVTLAHVDVAAHLFVHEDLQVHALAGAGSRLGGAGTPPSPVVGLGVEARASRLWLRGRLEVRRQRGGFRQGFFGPDYEVARFAVAGPTSLPAAEARFPTGYSAFGELVVEWDSLHLQFPRRQLDVSVALEAFSWGRLDVDARAVAWLAGRSLRVAVNTSVVGAGQPGARHVLSGEARYHFARWMYVLAQGGTLLFPGPEAKVRTGAFAALGLGAEYVQ